MGVRSRGRKAIIMVAAVAILALAIGIAAPATAVPFNEADFNGYATGNLVFAKALSTGTGADEVALANATEGFTGASVEIFANCFDISTCARCVCNASRYRLFGTSSA